MAHPEPIGFKDLFTCVIAEMARSLHDRPGETPEQKLLRTQIATRMILGLMPRDVLEAMLAGHCVMLHALLTECIHDTLASDRAVARRQACATIVAVDKAFHVNIDRLERYQSRPSDGIHVAETPAQPEAAPPEPAQAALPAAEGTPSLAGLAESLAPTLERIAACKANPAAMAALEAGDAAAFARAMGIEQPSEAWLAFAAGTPGPFSAATPAARPASGLNGAARR